MITWEYLTTPLLIHNTAAILNNWGKQGWELITIDAGVWIFKRPASDEGALGALEAIIEETVPLAESEGLAVPQDITSGRVPTS